MRKYQRGGGVQPPKSVISQYSTTETEQLMMNDERRPLKQQQQQQMRHHTIVQQQQQPRRRSDKELYRKIDPSRIEASTTHVMLKIGRAMFARLLFAVHSMVTVWQASVVRRNQSYWTFSLVSVGIIIEGGYTVIMRAGDERKLFCPSVFMYILGTVPPIWALEMDLAEKRLQILNNNFTLPSPLITVANLKDTIATSSTTTADPQDMETQARQLYEQHELWVQVLEQFLLVILIIGRWMLPKGTITREQLSQILLAYLAIASDIVELFVLFQETPVTKSIRLQYLILGVWALSLMQFPFVLTASRARKMRIAITKSTSEEEIKRLQQRALMSKAKQNSTCYNITHDVDIWAILLANLLQDVPFLLCRIYLMLGHSIITYTMIFFTCKNILIIMLQTYRAFIIIYDRYQKPKDIEDAKMLAQHYRTMLQECTDSLNALRARRRSAFNEAIGLDDQLESGTATSNRGIIIHNPYSPPYDQSTSSSRRGRGGGSSSAGATLDRPRSPRPASPRPGQLRSPSSQQQPLAAIPVYPATRRPAVNRRRSIHDEPGPHGVRYRGSFSQESRTPTQREADDAEEDSIRREIDGGAASRYAKRRHQNGSREFSTESLNGESRYQHNGGSSSTMPRSVHRRGDYDDDYVPSRESPKRRPESPTRPRRRRSPDRASGIDGATSGGGYQQRGASRSTTMGSREELPPEEYYHYSRGSDGSRESPRRGRPSRLKESSSGGDLAGQQQRRPPYKSPIKEDDRERDTDYHYSKREYND